MRETVGQILCILIFIICMILIPIQVVGMFHETTQVINIGPHTSEIWKWGRDLSADGLIILEDSESVVITQDDGRFVTATIPGKIPAGKKLPIFEAQFQAYPGSRYHNDGPIMIYSNQEIQVTFSWYPIIGNLFNIVLIILATCFFLWLIGKIFDLNTPF